MCLSPNGLCGVIGLCSCSQVHSAKGQCCRWNCIWISSEQLCSKELPHAAWLKILLLEAGEMKEKKLDGRIGHRAVFELSANLSNGLMGCGDEAWQFPHPEKRKLQERHGDMMAKCIYCCIILWNDISIQAKTTRDRKRPSETLADTWSRQHAQMHGTDVSH